MAGILDSKTRFIDLILTQEGKRQLASGDLRAEFASFTDMHAFYDSTLGAKDATSRIYFEVMDRPENVIVSEKDDKGRIIEMNVSTTASIVGDNIFLTSYENSDVGELLAADGSIFNSLSSDLISGSINHFQKNYLVGTKNRGTENNFTVDKKNISFTISNSFPFSRTPLDKIINVNDAEPFFLDKRLAYVSANQFLPPVNEDGSSYGNYTDFRNTTQQSWSDIKSTLGDIAFSAQTGLDLSNNPNVRYDSSGDFNVFNREDLVPVESVSLKEFQTISFTEKSEFNNFFFQVYETNSGSIQNNTSPMQNSIKKLDLIDGGVFYDENDPNQRYEKRVIYAGKVFIDDYNVPTFINIFTIVMDWLMIILNKNKKKLILNGVKGSHNFDTFPALINDIKKEEKSVTKRKKKKFLSNFSSQDNEKNLQIKLYLVLNKESILNGEISKMEVLLERSKLPEETSRTIGKGSPKSQKKSSQGFSYSREKLFDEKSNTVNDISKKKKNSKNSGRFISKKIRSYSDRSRSNIADKMKDENYRRVGYFSFDDVINSETVSKFNSPNFSKKEVLGERKKYILESKIPENKTRFKKASGSGRKINPELNKRSFAGTRVEDIEQDISKSKDLKSLFNSDDLSEASLRSKLSSRLQTSFISNDEAFKDLQKNSSVSDLNLNSSRFKEGEKRILSSDKDFSSSTAVAINQYNGLIQKRLSTSLSSIDEYVIGQYSQIRNIDLFSQVFNISKSKINDLTDGNQLSFLIKARDKKGRVVDSFSQQVNLTELRYLKTFPELDYDLSATRRGTNNFIKIKNNDDALLSFNVYRKSFKNSRDRNFKSYVLIRTLNISPGQSEKFKDHVPHGSANYRVTISHNGFEINNFKSIEVKDTKSIVRLNLDDTVNIVARNSNQDGHESIKIDISNIPISVKKITVVKKILSKRQTSFSQVSSFASRTRSQIADKILNDNPLLVDAETIFVNTSSPLVSYSFFDDDVEDQEVYEYRAKMTFSNGETKISSTSAIEMFEKRLGLIDLNSLVVSSGGALEQNTFGRSNNSFTLSGSVSNKTNEITRVFEELGRNNFELFKDDLGQIRESISKNLSLKVEVVNQNSFESIDLGEVQVTNISNSDSIQSKSAVDFKFSVPVSVDFSNDNMFLKVTPLTTLNSDIVSQVNEKIDRLVLDSVVSSDQAYNLLGAKKKLEKLSDRNKSSVSRKFSSRDYAKKGRIIAPGTKSAFSRSESVIEKESTGDIKYISIASNLSLDDNTVNVNFDGMTFLKSDEDILKRIREDLSIRGIMNLNLKTGGRNVDFVAIHSISRNGHINNHGMLFKSLETEKGFEPEERGILPLKCYFELDNPAGIYKFFAVVVQPNGTISRPIHVKNLKIDSRSVEVF